MKRGIVGTACTNYGASVVFGQGRCEPPLASIDESRSITAAYGCQTLVHDEDPDRGLPYRVDLGKPLRVERHISASPLFESADMDGFDSSWDSDICDRFGTAASHLVLQASKGLIDRCCVVVPDHMPSESAERILRKCSRFRSRALLLPWPMAASWAWLSTPPAQIVDVLFPESIHGKFLMCVYVGSDHLTMVLVRLVIHDDGTGNVVMPARNREKDEIRHCNIDPDSIVNAFGGIVDKSKDLAGIVISGKNHTHEKMLEFKKLFSDFVQDENLPPVSEDDFPNGLLAYGAMTVAAMLSRGQVPYYESLPSIELLASILVWEDRPRPVTQERFWGWLDCLKGVPDAIEIDGSMLIPANRLIRHRPDYKCLQLSSRQQQLKVAFDRQHVRVITATSDDPSVKTESGLSLAVDYRLGSGRPKITVERQKNPDSSIVFEWDSAAAVDEVRNNITPFTIEELEVMRREGELRRERAGMATR